MTVYVWTDSDGRVGAVTDDVRFSDGATSVDYPDVPEDATIFDYVLRDGSLVYDPLPEPEPAPDPVAIATEARQLADEAKAIAEQAGTDPSVMAFARMAVLPMAGDMTASEGASVSALWPERHVGDTVKLKDFFWYAGELYRCNQPELTITAGQTPDMNLPALYGHVSVAPDGILIWDADDLTGAPDIYNTGVRVHHPGEDGPVYVSKRDGNTSTPGTDQWWELAE